MGFHCLVGIFTFMNMKQHTKTCNNVGDRSNSWHRIVSLFHIMPVKKKKKKKKKKSKRMGPCNIDLYSEVGLIE